MVLLEERGWRAIGGGVAQPGPLLQHYRISAEELAWLSACVEELGRVVQTICEERIQMLERSAAA
jgi:hypothetical protein